MKKLNQKGSAEAIVLAIIAITAVALIVGIIVLVANSYRATQRDISITVNDKERNGTNGDGYLVFAKGETFSITDSTLYGQFNSSDIYGSLQRGKTYDCSVVGWRNGFFSMYRNIIKCTEQETTKKDAK